MAEENIKRRLPRPSNSKPTLRLYVLEDFIGKSNEFIKEHLDNALIVNYECLINNFDLVKKLFSIKKIKEIRCLDYESALYLENNLNEDFYLVMVDDYQNKDRSYIDVTLIKKHILYVPLSYFMWGIKFENSCNIKCLRFESSGYMTSINGDSKLYRSTLKKITEILQNLDTKNISDIDKCILISNYLQSKVQYVGGMEFHGDKLYTVEANNEEVTEEKIGSVDTVINENYGLCMAIANATTLLLNNPIMNLNVRSVYGDGHVWNVITIDGKQYYLDNTWAITRNKNRVEEALKATSFTDDYLLFGRTTANSIGHHNSLCYCNGVVEQDDYNKEDIQKHIKRLSKKYNFTNYPKNLRFKSKVIEE